MKVEVYGETNVGKHRDHNEDAFLILGDLDNKWQEVNNLQLELSTSKGLFIVVADGMGGANAGEVASSIAVTKVGEKVRLLNNYLTDEHVIQKYLASIILDAHNSIVKKARGNEEMKGMGTTMVLGCILDNHFFVEWAGDSRAYIYNTTKQTQLVPFSEDHSLVWNRVKNGEITPEEARLRDDSNLILNALGDSFQKPIPDFKKIKLDVGDRIVLCSDGLNSMLSDTGIQQIMEYNSNAKDTCQALISAANNAGGLDNITVLVIDVIEESPLTIPKQKMKRKRRKWLIFGLILLIVLIASCVLLFTNEIKDFISDKTNSSNPAMGKSDDAIIGKTDNLISPPSQSNNPNVTNPEMPSYSAVNQTDKAPSDVLPTSERKTSSALSTSKIKADLEIEYKRIDMLKKDLNRYNPGGDMYLENEEFCRMNEKKINDVINKLDSIKNQIESVVYAPGNTIVSVKDQNKAVLILKTLKTSIDNLDILKEEILTTSKN
jgi:serine/threonine protein phosphatase PrpC